MTSIATVLRDLSAEELITLSNELTQTTVPEDALIRKVIKGTELDDVSSPVLAFVGVAGHLHVELVVRLEAHREALKAIVQYTDEKYSKAVARNALNEGQHGKY